MKIAYIIIAHKNPLQLLRLIQRLQSNDAYFFIHIDKKVNLKEFQHTLKVLNNPHVTFIYPRENGRWGGIGVVKASLHAMHAIINHPDKIDYVVALTGQCYPIKNVTQIEDFYKENRDKNFMYTFPMPGKWSIKQMDRINRYHYFLKRSRVFPPYEEPTTIIGKIFNTALKAYFPLPRKQPIGIIPHGGSAFFNLNRTAVENVLNFINTRPDFLKFHEYSLIPDEMFFQSILCSSKDDIILQSIVPEDLRFRFWESRYAANPAVLKQKDYKMIVDSNQLFARKFDTTIDSTILDMLDRQAA